jgi:hypothetical protein
MTPDGPAALEALLQHAVTLRQKSREIIAEQNRAQFAAAFEMACRAQEAVDFRDQRPGNQ